MRWTKKDFLILLLLVLLLALVGRVKGAEVDSALAPSVSSSTAAW